MYSIKKTDYGIRVTMNGRYEADEISRYIAEKEALLTQHQGPFSLLVDLRGAIPPNDGDESLLSASQARMKQGNLLRMAVIVMSPVIEAQVKQMVLSAGIGDRTRVINANKMRDWETVAEDWIIKAVEPVDQRTLGDSGPNPIQVLGNFSRKM